MISVDWARLAGANGSSANARRVWGSDTPPSVCRQAVVAVAISAGAGKRTWPSAPTNRDNGSLAFVDWHRGARSWPDVLRSGDVTVTGPAWLRRSFPTWNRHHPEILTERC
jgi:hypothetical protein